MLVTISCSVCAGAIAQTPVPELHARVTDLTATLTAEQVATLDGELAELESRKGAQIAVLMVGTLAPPADVPAAADDIETFATHVFERWKLGRKGVDDGVLLIVVRDDRKVRIEVGYGLEGAIPDAAAARIIREYVTPKFREGDYYGGIHDATATLARLIDGESLPAPLEGTPAAVWPEPQAPWWWALFGVVFASLMLGFLLAATLKCLFNVFPIRVVPIRVRRAVGLLAGPSIIAGFLWWASSQSAGDGTPVVANEFANGSAPFALAAVITGWLGFRIAPEGASKTWAGGMKWKDLPGFIFDLTIGMLLSGFTNGFVSVGGSGSGGGFSGGGGSSGGGGASGSW
ncbi:MAG TPA: TPM domain-containing protein [Rudaea sp.]|nr:TPM domain-containing protein [Rudaea sp.]